ncbi:MAG: DUF3373 domain-containing protein [Rhodocyclaceae bacterium]|nr:DUF3373 domain-containing protein [Rhodocyclaceae bacterium]
MNQTFRKKLLVTLIAGLALPMVASAADADLLKRLEALSREIETLRAQVKASEEKVNTLAAKSDTVAVADLKGKVQRLEDKSLSKWLSVGGSYQFRADSLRGETKPFMDVQNAFKVMQTNAMMMPTTASPSLAELVMVSEGMKTISTYQAADGFLTAVQTMTPAQLAALAATGPAGAAQAAGISAGQSMLGYIMNPANAPILQVPAYKPKNSALYTNRFTLDLGAKATQDVSVNARLAMYKVFGSQSDAALSNSGAAPFFADRVGVFDGTVSHVPSDSRLNVDRVYGTWSNIADMDMWFSVGRRPSTGGAPNNLRTNNPRPGNGGTPGLLVDYAFDGMTLGYAPEIDALPGAYGKICYGVGFDSGFSRTGNSIKDTTMLGIALVPIDTDPLRVWLQWNRGMKIFDAPEMKGTYFGNTAPTINLGDIDWFGIGAMSTFKGVGGGDLHVFADWGLSRTNPNNNVSSQFGFQGLLTGAFFQPEAPSKKTGTAIALGMRYDLPSKTKIGFEYNKGSKNWITFAPAADDVWTSKYGTRGDVYEAYIIQELDRMAISSLQSRAFFRLGAKYYNFKYTGSNNWVGKPIAISDVSGQMMTTTPLKNASDIYATFEVKF